MLWRTNNSFLLKKDTEKTLLKVKDLISIIVKLPSWEPVFFIYNDLLTGGILKLYWKKFMPLLWAVTNIQKQNIEHKTDFRICFRHF